MFKIFTLVLSNVAVLAPLTYSHAASGVNVGFSPEGSAETQVLGVIDHAQTEIRLAGYSFTSPEIASALIRARTRSVDVRIVLDNRANQNRSSRAAINLLAARGIPVRLNGKYGALHDKFIIADGRTVETGSYNYTRAAARRNSENALIIENMPELASRYLHTGSLDGTKVLRTGSRTDTP